MVSNVKLLKVVPQVLSELLIAAACFNLIIFPEVNFVLIAAFYFVTNVWWFFFAALMIDFFTSNQKRHSKYHTLFWSSVVAILTILPFTALIFLYHFHFELEILSLTTYLLVLLLFLVRNFVSPLLVYLFSGLQQLKGEINILGKHIFCFQIPALGASVVLVPVFSFSNQVNNYIGILFLLSVLVSIGIYWYSKTNSKT